MKLNELTSLSALAVKVREQEYSDAKLTDAVIPDLLVEQFKEFNDLLATRDIDSFYIKLVSGEEELTDDQESILAWAAELQNE